LGTKYSVKTPSTDFIFRKWDRSATQDTSSRLGNHGVH